MILHYHFISSSSYDLFYLFSFLPQVILPDFFRGESRVSEAIINLNEFFLRFSEREGGHFRFFHPSIIQRKCCRFVQKIAIYLLKAREGDKGRSENLWKFIQFDEEKLKSFSTRWKNWDMCCLIGRDVTRSWRLAERSEQLVSFTKESFPEK